MNHQHNCPCHPIQCIVPPYMVEAIKMRGSAKQRKMAVTLQKEARIYREERVEAMPPKGFMPAPVMAAGAPAILKREVYDGQKKATLPGKLIRKEGDPPTGDAAADAAYDGAGDTYKLFLDVYLRNSLDGKGMKLISTVHHRRAYNNAFWDGTQMAYGDGDDIIFKTFTVTSVIGHELSHGVVQFSGGLTYKDQSGALNESFADVFGCLTEQRKLGHSACEANWLVGEGILADGVNGQALRSMKAPGTAFDDALLGKDPQPFHMNDYVVTSDDEGGVHINSGIPNHAFYLLAQYLGGNAWEKAGHIWYDAMQSINNPFATFNNWADKTVEMARARYGTNSLEVIYTRRAWKLVGIDV